MKIFSIFYVYEHSYAKRLDCPYFLKEPIFYVPCIQIGELTKNIDENPLINIIVPEDI